ncbi:MAG TPA: hypothetical protein VMH27_12440 [Puia sp.]|nr:hypothetical protein [Puia sp.]
MKQLYTFTFLALAAVVGLSSCSSSKNAQNGPDMYSSGKTNGSDYVAAAPNDQYVQMKSQDYDRWSYFDDYNAYDAYYAPAPMYYAGGVGFGYNGFGIPMYYPGYYGLGYNPFGPSFGFGFGDPYLAWNNYFIWNTWYNPYFYNPYYGGGVVAVGKSPTSIYNNLRPFNATNYKSGLAHYGVTGNSRNVVYRPGMRSTTAYNSNVTTRNPGAFRPANNNNTFRNYNAPSRSYNPPARSYSPSFGNGGGGGGFRGGGFRH